MLFRSMGGTGSSEAAADLRYILTNRRSLQRASVNSSNFPVHRSANAEFVPFVRDGHTGGKRLFFQR